MKVAVIAMNILCVLLYMLEAIAEFLSGKPWRFDAVICFVWLIAASANMGGLRGRHRL